MAKVPDLSKLVSATKLKAIQRAMLKHGSQVAKKAKPKGR